MAWNFTADKPIYAQIAERLKQDILSGKHPAGDKLPTVRDLAAEAAVNPNTMQKAFAELEQEGLIVTQRTAGRTVTTDNNALAEARELMLEELTRDYLQRIIQMGSTKEDAVRLIEKMKEDSRERREN